MVWHGIHTLTLTYTDNVSVNVIHFICTFSFVLFAVFYNITLVFQLYLRFPFRFNAAPSSSSSSLSYLRYTFRSLSIPLCPHWAESLSIGFSAPSFDSFPIRFRFCTKAITKIYNRYARDRSRWVPLHRYYFSLEREVEKGDRTAKHSQCKMGWKDKQHGIEAWKEGKEKKKTRKDKKKEEKKKQIFIMAAYASSLAAMQNCITFFGSENSRRASLDIFERRRSYASKMIWTDATCARISREMPCIEFHLQLHY